MLFLKFYLNIKKKTFDQVRHNISCRKNGAAIYTTGEKRLRTCLAVSTQYTNDRRSASDSNAMTNIN